MDGKHIRPAMHNTGCPAMDPEAAKAYIDAKADQIEQAIRGKNKYAAMQVIDSIASDGHPDLANDIRTSVMALFAQDRRPQ